MGKEKENGTEGSVEKEILLYGIRKRIESWR